MAATIKINIVSAESDIFTGVGEMVFAPGSQGELGIAPGHTPLLTSLKPGQVRIELEGEEKSFYISGGMLEVQPTEVTVLSDTAIRADDLDEARAIAAKESAEKIISDKATGEEYAEAISNLQQAMAQIEAISSLRKRAGSRH